MLLTFNETVQVDKKLSSKDKEIFQNCRFYLQRDKNKNFYCLSYLKNEALLYHKFFNGKSLEAYSLQIFSFFFKP